MHQKNILIPDPSILEHKIYKVRSAGIEKFHVVADFDRTLTKAYVDGKSSPSAIAQIRNGDYLDPEYSAIAHKLYDKYSHIESDFSLSYDYRATKMREWWKEHFRVLVKFGLSKNVIEDVVSDRRLRFREGAFDFIDFLGKLSVPLLIMSAGLGDLISGYLRQENRLYKNIHIVSNFFEYDSKGNVVSVHEPIILSLNKHEVILKDFPFYSNLLAKPNVLLLGDNIEDNGMVSGTSPDNVIRVGFLNEKVDEKLDIYKKNFDIVITNDEGMSFVNDLIGRLFVYN